MYRSSSLHTFSKYVAYKSTLEQMMEGTSKKRESHYRPTAVLNSPKKTISFMHVHDASNTHTHPHKRCKRMSYTRHVQKKIVIKFYIASFYSTIVLDTQYRNAIQTVFLYAFSEY